MLFYVYCETIWSHNNCDGYYGNYVFFDRKWPKILTTTHCVVCMVFDGFCQPMSKMGHHHLSSMWKSSPAISNHLIENGLIVQKSYGQTLTTTTIQLPDQIWNVLLLFYTAKHQTLDKISSCIIMSLAWYDRVQSFVKKYCN